MTKIQMTATANALMVEHKASTKMKEAMALLLEEFNAGNRGTANKIIQDIEVDGIEYRWCNRHEFYEPKVNFANDKKTTVCCKLGAKHWANLGKDIKTANDELMAKALEGVDGREVAVKLNDLRETRSGRYSFEGNALQYPDIENFDYNTENFKKLEDAV